MSETTDESGKRRRLGLLVLLAIVILLGAGIGSFTLLDSDGAAPEEPVGVTLETTGEGTLLAADSIFPGDAGTGRITLQNEGERAGRIRLARTEITDRYPATDRPTATPAQIVSARPLSQVLAVRLTFVYSDGTETTVIGSESTYVPLASVNDSETVDRSIAPGETVTVRLDWRLAKDVGNDIQGTETTFDAVFELRAPEP